MQYFIGYTFVLSLGFGMIALIVSGCLKQFERQLASQTAGVGDVLLRLQKEAGWLLEAASAEPKVAVKADTLPPYELEYQLENRGETMVHTIVVWPKRVGLSDKGEIVPVAVMAFVRKEIETLGTDPDTCRLEDINLASLARVSFSMPRETHRRLVLK